MGLREADALSGGSYGPNAVGVFCTLQSKAVNGICVRASVYGVIHFQFLTEILSKSSICQIFKKDFTYYKRSETYSYLTDKHVIDG